MITYLHVTTLFMSEDVKQEVSACVSQIEGAEHRMLDKHNGEQIAILAESEIPDMLIYQMNGGDAYEFEELAEFVESHHGQMSVIVIRKTVDADSTRRLMRAGVRDVLPFPLDRQELGMLLNEVLSEKRRRITDQRGNLAGTTSFINAKGGCGSTTIAINTACNLVMKYQAKVALLDFDVQFGDAALYLDLKPEATLIDALMHVDRMDGVFLDALMTKHECGLDLLASPSSMDAVLDINPSDINKLLETIVANYDFVFIDLPMMVLPWTVNTLKFSEHIMMVMQNNLSTIKNAKMMMRVFPDMGIGVDKVELINNRAMAKTNSVDFEKFKEAMRRDKMHRIRNDFQTVLASQDMGVSLERIESKSKATKDMEHFSDYIWACQYGEVKPQAGFFARLLHRGESQQQKPLH